MEKQTTDYLTTQGINPWGNAMTYAESIVPMVVGKSTTADYDHQMEVKTAYEEGFAKAVELLKEKGVIQY